MIHKIVTSLQKTETSPVRFPSITKAFENSLVDLLMRELQFVIHDLGREGGLVSPSVYDTSQRLRLVPPLDSIELTLNWLIDQQQTDGGWGDPFLPAYRDIPSLAAILALQQYQQFPRCNDALHAGLNFFQTNIYDWSQNNLDNLPVAAELIVPYLLEECRVAGLSLSSKPYVELIVIGNYKLQKLNQILSQAPPQAGDPILHCWEVWGKEPDTSMIDNLGGVSCSAAATVAWLKKAFNHSALAKDREKVQNYLNHSAAMTKSGVPGVFPTIWPINIFEICWGLEALLLTRLLHHPALTHIVLQQSREIVDIIKPTGLGASQFLIPDADDTATGIALLHAIGEPVDISILKKFEKDGVFFTYPDERNPSTAATSRGIRALAMTGETISKNSINVILKFRSADGRWWDKWHASWLYATLQCLLALLHTGEHDVLDKTISAYLLHQHPDGGWGEGNRSTAEETAYAIIALLSLEQFGFKNEHHDIALKGGFRWLLKNYNPCQWSKNALYLSKELYNPYRITHAYILSAMLGLALGDRSNLTG